MSRLWKWWKGIAKKIGEAQGRLLLTIFYFIVLAPFALAVRVFGDPLAIKASAPRGWRPREDVECPTMDRATRQF